MAQNSFKLVRYFVINYFVAIGILAVVITFIFSGLGQANLIRVTQEHSISIARNLSFEIHQHFFIPRSRTLATFDPLDAEQLRAMDEIARRFLRHLDVVKINIFDTSCRLVYSTNPRLIGAYTRDNGKLLAALRGEHVSGLELAHDEPDIESDVHSQDLLETYIPFRRMTSDLETETEIIGSFEIYQDVTALHQQIGHFRKLVFAASFAVMGVLFIVLLVIVRKADRIRGRLEAEIAKHTEHLEDMVQSRTRELHEEKNRLRAILDHVPSAFITLDRRLHVESASAALYDLTGYRFEEVRGKPCYAVFGRAEPCESCPSRRGLASGQIESEVKSAPHSGAEERFLEHVAVPIKRDGQVESILEIVTDITERKRFHEQMIRTEKLSATGEMAAVVAHEIRNSLTSVKLILQFLSESDTATDPEKESMRVAVGSIRQMEGVVSELLHFARPTPARMVARNLNDVVRESIGLSRHQLDRKGIRLVECLDPEVPEMRLDPDHLKEAFINLILNATQAVPDEGEIRISTKVTRSSRRWSEPPSEQGPAITVEAGQNLVAAEISDSGCGIPREHLGRIFDPFFTTKNDGTGLGLAMVRRVVHEHGGVIVVDSEPREGTRFTILLPLRARAPRTERQGTTAAKPSCTRQ